MSSQNSALHVVIENLLKTKGGNSGTEKASAFKKLTFLLNGHEFFVAVFQQNGSLCTFYHCIKTLTFLHFS